MKHSSCFKSRGENSNKKYDVQDEQNWFAKDVTDLAKAQIEKNHKWLEDEHTIPLRNELGETIVLDKTKIKRTINVVIYRPHTELDADNPFYKVKHSLSKEAGFVHYLSLYDYAACFITFSTPVELFEYFIHRQWLIEHFPNESSIASESVLIGNYLSRQLPHPSNKPLHSPCLEDIDVYNAIKRVNRKTIASTINDIGAGVYSKGIPTDMAMYKKVIDIFSILRGHEIRKLTDILTQAINRVLESQFTDPHAQTNIFIEQTMYSYHSATSFSFNVINQHDKIVTMRYDVPPFLDRSFNCYFCPERNLFPCLNGESSVRS